MAQESVAIGPNALTKLQVQPDKLHASRVDGEDQSGSKDLSVVHTPLPPTYISAIIKSVGMMKWDQPPVKPWDGVNQQQKPQCWYPELFPVLLPVCYQRHLRFAATEHFFDSSSLTSSLDKCIAAKDMGLPKHHHHHHHQHTPDPRLAQTGQVTQINWSQTLRQVWSLSPSPAFSLSDRKPVSLVYIFTLWIKKLKWP